MNKRVIAVVISVLLGGVLVFFGQKFTEYVFPAKSPLPTDVTLWADYIQNEVPFMSKLFLLLSYAFASFATGIISTAITGRTTMRPMLASVAILFGLALFQFLFIPHPTWMWIGVFIAFFPMGLLAYFLIRKKPNHD